MGKTGTVGRPGTGDGACGFISMVPKVHGMFISSNEQVDAESRAHFNLNTCKSYRVHFEPLFIKKRILLLSREMYYYTNQFILLVVALTLLGFTVGRVTVKCGRAVDLYVGKDAPHVFVRIPYYSFRPVLLIKHGRLLFTRVSTIVSFCAKKVLWTFRVHSVRILVFLKAKHIWIILRVLFWPNRKIKSKFQSHSKIPPFYPVTAPWIATRFKSPVFLGSIPSNSFLLRLVQFPLNDYKCCPLLSKYWTVWDFLLCPDPVRL